MSLLPYLLPWQDRFAKRNPSAAASVAMRAPLSISRSFSAAWQRLLSAKQAISARQAQGSSRRLRVVEKVMLGDKQFVALLEVDGQTVLASGGGGVPLQLASSQVLHPASASQSMAQFPGEVPSVFQNSRREQVADIAALISVVLPTLPALALEPEHEVPQIGSQPVSRHQEAVFPEETVGKKRTSTPGNSTSTLPQARTPKASKVSKQGSAPGWKGDENEGGSQGTIETPAPEPIPDGEGAKAQGTRKRGTAAKKAVSVQEAKANTPEPVPGESRAAAPPKRSKKGGLADTAGDVRPQQAQPGPDDGSQEGASAATAFAALLELRMLAGEVFDAIESSEAKAPSQTGKPTRALENTPTPRGEKPSAASEKKPASGGLDRLRQRFSAYGCLLFLLFIPHAIAHAATLPSPGGAFAAVSVAGSSMAQANLLGRGSLVGSPDIFGVAAVSTLAAAVPPSNEIRISGLGGSSASWSIVVVLTLLALIPSLLMCITPFARLLIVFHFLRQALGLQTTPSNQTLIGLSLILTFFLMQPTAEVIYRDAVLPVEAGKLTPLDGVVRAGEPMKHFMAHYVREKDAELFLEIAKEPRPRSVEGLSFRVLLPAYILSELKAGFQIGTVLFLPFLIVDMVIASITTSVGMMQLPPVVISTPLKLLLFLMVDGWHLLIGALMRSFN